jgi:lipoate-protein ligase A
MLCILNDITDPYFNIASEEYLLKSFSDDVFMLYCNELSIIIGKHQNTFAEINYWFVKEKGIRVIRRLSGGGTVFHDSGNLNFTFIRNGNEGNLIDFKRFTQPIIEVLHQLGVPAEYSGKNDLRIKGLKFSGNAEHIYKNRTLHHGTLLFSSKLDNLSEALRVSPEQVEDKAVKSVRTKVTNIRDHLPASIRFEGFRNTMYQHVLSNTPGALPYSFTQQDIENIRRSVNEKYATWEWNYGYSPRFTFRKKGSIGGDSFDIELDVEKGTILHAVVNVNGTTEPAFSQILNGVYYREDDIYFELKKIRGIKPGSLIILFF